MIRRFAFLLLLSILFCAPVQAGIQNVWSKLEAARITDPNQRLYRLDESSLRDRLLLLPHESSGDPGAEIELPMPDGGLGRFRIVESPILQDQLAAAFPEFRSYRVSGIDDPFAMGRVSLSPLGFHGLILSSQGRLFIDPEGAAGDGRYIARRSGMRAPMRNSCAVHEVDQSDRPAMQSRVDPLMARESGKLLEYVIAVSATEEYVAAVAGPGDIAGAQLEINAAINRVNVIYERDHGILLTLVAGNENLIENGGNVSFSNDNPFALLAENQTWIDSQINTSDYDLGHVFSTGAGGLATLGSVCNASSKAQGVSGLSTPEEDPFYIDFVAHEIGHQFNADHTFNGTSFSCLGNRNPSTAWEPGSGSTIMAYSGLCAAENLQTLSEATFHAGSIEQVHNFSREAGCGRPVDSVPVANTDPLVASIPDYTIPADTPFRLTGSAVDAESGTLLYQWDQMDAGTATDSTTFGTDLGDNALFRSYEPSLAAAQRDFPALGTQVRGLYDPAETIPCQSRDLNLRLTVRDNNGGQATEDVKLTVTQNAGPFEVTSHSVAITETGNFVVDWNVAATSLSPVNCPNVGIDLIAFNNVSYSRHTIHSLIPSTPNNGSVIVTWPADSLEEPARGRIRVRCLNNVFYAISQADVFIFGSNVPQTFFDNDDIPTFAPEVTRTSAAPSCPTLDSGGGGSDGGSGGDDVPYDAGFMDPRWVMILAMLALGLRRWRG